MVFLCERERMRKKGDSGTLGPPLAPPNSTKHLYLYQYFL